MSSKLSYVRFKALCLHYLYSAKRNPARFIEILIWPSLELILFSLLTLQIERSTKVQEKLGLGILSGIVFWNFFSRIIQETVSQFVDDVLSRNVQNLLSTPITLFEFVLSLLSVSFIKIALSFVVLSIIIAYFFSNFFYTVGYTSILWILTIVFFGSTVALLAVAFLFIFGERISFIGWILSVIIQVFSCVFYERSVLPPPLKEISYLVPSSYIFESMRTFMRTKIFDLQSLAYAFFITVGYLIIIFIIFRLSFNYAQRSGSLTKL